MESSSLQELEQIPGVGKIIGIERTEIMFCKRLNGKSRITLSESRPNLQRRRQ